MIFIKKVLLYLLCLLSCFSIGYTITCLYYDVFDNKITHEETMFMDHFIEEYYDKNNSIEI